MREHFSPGLPPASRASIRATGIPMKLELSGDELTVTLEGWERVWALRGSDVHRQ